MHPPHIPKILIKKSCLLWIRMVLENFYRYKKKPKQTKNRLFVSSWKELYKQISLENYHSTWNLIKLMLFAQPIIIILVYWPCHWLVLSPPRFLLFPGPNLQPAVSMSCTSPCYLLMVQYPVYSCIRCSKRNHNFISLLVKIKQHMMYK